MKIVVSALYKFTSLSRPTDYKVPLVEFMKENNIRGTFILAPEGINGTVAGERKAIDALYRWFETQKPFKSINAKESFDREFPFHRVKVKIKKEIVTMRVPHVDPRKIVGTYVKPEDWNDLIKDPDVTLIDTRNDYEVQIGTFKGAINPQTKEFRQFPNYVKKNLNPKKHKKIAMFCTGGIRCEKATAYLKQNGFKNVFHLKGGILKYLENIKKKESLWNGECFVFDNRVAVKHGLKKGQYEMCHSCRMPISPQDKKHPHYSAGSSCPHCFGTKSPQKLRGLKERERQVQIATRRGQQHIGVSL